MGKKYICWAELDTNTVSQHFFTLKINFDGGGGGRGGGVLMIIKICKI